MRACGCEGGPLPRSATPGRISSEDVDVLAHAAALILRDALGDPHNVPDLLLLELHKRVVHAVVELLLKGEAVEVDLELEELVLERLLLLEAKLLQQRPIVGVRVDGAAHRVEVGGAREARGALGVEQPDGRVERLALFEVEVGARLVLDLVKDQQQVQDILFKKLSKLIGSASTFHEMTS